SHVDYFNDNVNNRFITFLMYLNEVPFGGGNTSFPEAHSSCLDERGYFGLHPGKGNIMFFYDLLEDGNVDATTLHRAEPPLHGTEKWMTSSLLYNIFPTTKKKFFFFVDLWIWDPVYAANSGESETFDGAENAQDKQKQIENKTQRNISPKQIIKKNDMCNSNALSLRKIKSHKLVMSIMAFLKKNLLVISRKIHNHWIVRKFDLFRFNIGKHEIIIYNYLLYSVKTFRTMFSALALKRDFQKGLDMESTRKKRQSDRLSLRKQQRFENLKRRRIGLSKVEDKETESKTWECVLEECERKLRLQGNCQGKWKDCDN
ncbi:hypothetical protein RFI_27693, partial [Reticulomyxa filosa]